MTKPVYVGTLIERLQFYAEDMDDDDKLPWHFYDDMRQSIDEIRNRDAEIGSLRAYQAKLIDALEEALPYVERFEDAVDGAYGCHEPNAAAVLADEIRSRLSTIDKSAREGGGHG